MRLQSLPPEIIQSVVLRLDVDQTLTLLSRTCMVFRVLLSDPEFAAVHLDFARCRASIDWRPITKLPFAYRCAALVFEDFLLHVQSSDVQQLSQRISIAVTNLWCRFSPFTTAMLLLIAGKFGLEESFDLILACQGQSSPYCARIPSADFTLVPNEVYLILVDGIIAQHSEIAKKLCASTQRFDLSVHNNLPFVLAVKHGQLQLLQLLTMDPSTKVDYDEQGCILILAARNGHAEVIEYLKSIWRLDSVPNVAFIAATESGKAAVVDWFLTNEPPTAAVCVQGLMNASRLGHVDIVRLLLADGRTDPRMFHNRALRLACMGGHLEVVRCLLSDERVNTVEGDDIAIKNVLVYGHLRIAELLLDDGVANIIPLSNWAIH